MLCTISVNQNPTVHRPSHREKYQSLHMQSLRKVSIDSSTRATSIRSSDLSEIVRLVEEPATELFSPLRLLSPESVNSATVFQLRSTYENSHLSAPFNASQRWIRKGFWNRRGDHLTEDGFIVYAPPYQVYPRDLQDYPSESDGYRDEHGHFVDFVARGEHPDSLPHRGNAPARPYLSVSTSCISLCFVTELACSSLNTCDMAILGIPWNVNRKIYSS